MLSPCRASSVAILGEFENILPGFAPPEFLFKGVMRRFAFRANDSLLHTESIGPPLTNPRFINWSLTISNELILGMKFGR